MSLDREQSLKEALKSIEKQYGKGAVMVMGENPVEKMEVMNPTLIDYMKSAVSSSEVNDYECIKENLYNIFHGKA